MKALFASTLLVLAFGSAQAETTLDNSDVGKLEATTPVDLADNKYTFPEGTVCRSKKTENGNIQILISYAGYGVHRFKDVQDPSGSAAFDNAGVTDFRPETAKFIMAAMEEDGCTLDTKALDEAQASKAEIKKAE